MTDRLFPRCGQLSLFIAGLVMASMLFACTPAGPQRGAKDIEVQYVFGHLREVSPQQGFLVIESSRKPSIRLDLNEQSERIGFASLDELDEGDNFKVWYVTEGGTKKILKIEKLPFLGCAPPMS